MQPAVAGSVGAGHDQRQLGRAAASAVQDHQTNVRQRRCSVRPTKRNIVLVIAALADIAEHRRDLGVVISISEFRPFTSRHGVSLVRPP